MDATDFDTPDEPTLPKPWKRLVETGTGYLYYWNSEFNLTQYHRPASSSPPKLSASLVSSSVQTQQSSSGLYFGKEEDTYNRGSDGPKSDSRSRFNEARRTGLIFWNDAASGQGNAACGGSSARRPPSSATGNEFSPEAYCSRHEITVSGGQVPPPLMSLEATGLPPELLREAFVMDATDSASTIPYAPDDPTLPKPWKCLVESGTGFLYYWNPEFNLTQYHRPASSSPPKHSASLVSSSVQTQQSSSGLNSGKEEDTYNRGSDGPKSDSGSRFTEAGRTGPIFLNDAASGQGNAACGGSSARKPPSATGNELYSDHPKN